MNFSCPRTVTVHSYVLTCCALHASKYAPSYSHSSWYWAAVRRVICWPALSSYGQLINSSKTRCWDDVSFQIQNSFHYRFRIVLGRRYRWDLVSLWAFLCQMLCIFAVFERQVNKCSPVATTSQPSTLRVAPRLSRAVTVSQPQLNSPQHNLILTQLCWAVSYTHLTLPTT